VITSKLDIHLPQPAHKRAYQRNAMKCPKANVVALICYAAYNSKNTCAFSRNQRQICARTLNLSPRKPSSNLMLTNVATEVPSISSQNRVPADVRYSEFLKLVGTNRLEKVTFNAQGTKLTGVDKDGEQFKIEALPHDPDILTELNAHKVDVIILPAQKAGVLEVLVQSLIVPALLFGGLFFLSNRASDDSRGGIFGIFRFGKSRSKVQLVPETGVTLEDVAGCDGAKLELAEVVDFLKQPEAYTKNGCLYFRI